MFKVSSNKWYGRFLPSERRKIQVMQALVDYYEPEMTALGGLNVKATILNAPLEEQREALSNFAGAIRTISMVADEEAQISPTPKERISKGL